MSIRLKVLKFWFVIQVIFVCFSAAYVFAEADEHYLTPVTQHVAISRKGAVDEANYKSTTSFLSKNYNPSRPLSFLDHGVDSPGQPFRTKPTAMVKNTDGSRIYVALTGDEAEPGYQIAVIDPDVAPHIIEYLKCGPAPAGLYFDNTSNYLYVSYLYANYVSVFDSATSSEIGRILLTIKGSDRYFNQSITPGGGGKKLYITNKMMGSLIEVTLSDSRTSAVAIHEIPLYNDNILSDTSGEPEKSPVGLIAEPNRLDPFAFGISRAASPPELKRRLTQVNPHNVVMANGVTLSEGGKTDLAYVANMNGLGISIVDLQKRSQIATIDLNSPAFSIAKYESPNRRYVFIGTGSRFANGFEDVRSEIAVIDIIEDPTSLISRFTADVSMPVGPLGAIGFARPVDPAGPTAYQSSFAMSTIVRGNSSVNRNRDFLPELRMGGLPSGMAVLNKILYVSYATSDEIYSYFINTEPAHWSDILRFRDRKPTNILGDVFPTRSVQNRLSFKPDIYGQLYANIFENGSIETPDASSANPLTGSNEPEYFVGRFPISPLTDTEKHRLYILNKLGEWVSFFDVPDDGTIALSPRRGVSVRVTRKGKLTPQFPATLSELGEDFYTTSRISLDRQISCVFCHPSTNTDSKVWDSMSSPGFTRRDVLTNRNLRDTPPYGHSGTRSNLEICSRIFSFLPRSFFGATLSPGDAGFRDANNDGKRDKADIGRPQVDINRDAMLVFERAGIGASYIGAALTAFMESEPRLLPNPFKLNGHIAEQHVPIRISNQIVTGNAKQGEKLFGELKCTICHPSPLFTNNRTFTRFNNIKNGMESILDTNRGDMVMRDIDKDGILDGVVLSFEDSSFGPGSAKTPAETRLLPNGGITSKVFGNIAFPVQRSEENQMDINSHVFISNNFGEDYFPYNKGRRSYTSRSVFPIDSNNYSLDRQEGYGNGRLLANEPNIGNDQDVKSSGSDGRNLNVPSLRNAWDSAPYLHHGRASNLYELVNPESEFNFPRDRNSGEITGPPINRHGALDKIKGDVNALRALAAYLQTIE